MKGIDIIIAILIFIFILYFKRFFSKLKRENFGVRGGGRGIYGGGWGGRNRGWRGRDGYYRGGYGGLGLGLGLGNAYYTNPQVIVVEEQKYDDFPWYYRLIGY